MRLRVLPGLLVAATLALCPTSAFALLDGGFFRWWDSLSGPGPFNGVVIDAMLVCYGSHFTGKPSPDPNVSNDGYTTEVFINPGCLQARRDRRRISVGLQWAALWSERNDLPYESGRKAPQVKAYPFMIVAHYGLNKGIDVGAGVGVVKFSGDGFGFTRFIFEPRVSVRPFALLSKKPNPPLITDIIDLRVFATAIPGTIDAADFGATGSWRSEGEMQYGFSITFNGFALIGQRR